MRPLRIAVLKTVENEAMVVHYAFLPRRHRSRLPLLIALLPCLLSPLNASAQYAQNRYATLPEFSGPYSEITNIPNSLKSVSVLKAAAADEIVLLPTTIVQLNYRVEYSALSMSGLSAEPAAILELFAQTVTDEAVYDEVSKAFPGAKIGRPRVSSNLVAKFVAPELFVGNSDAAVNAGLNPSISDLIRVTAQLKAIALPIMRSDSQMAVVQVEYELPLSDGIRRYSTGITMSFNCNKSPESFFDVLNLRHGCPGSEWDHSRVVEFSDRVLECLSKASMSDAPPTLRDRLIDWTRRDCIASLLAGSRSR